jgi:heme oxygenase
LYHWKEQKEHNNDGWREEVIRLAEEEEEEGERKSFSGAYCEFGAFKAWTDEVVDRVGVAS